MGSPSSSRRPRISVVAAARPNFMKVGPVIRALEGDAAVELVHTGQHYDAGMSDAFFRDLGLPEPDVNLGVGPGTHAEQTAGVLVAYERYLLEREVDAVVVVGDVNSTVAASLAATKLHVPVAHVEAGLRSNDWRMPEEINRVVTDRISRWLFTPSGDADENLIREGIPRERIHLVGNVMIDTLLANLGRARERGRVRRDVLGLPERFAVMTLHRPSNVDESRSLQRLLGALVELAAEAPIVFPVHPRTMARLKEFGVHLPDGIIPVEPMGYLEFVGLVAQAAVVYTDSGGIQEETSVLGIPCLTLRANTERPVTCTHGTNRLVGTDPAKVIEAGRCALESSVETADIPFWDGCAGERIAKILLNDLAG